MSKGSCDILVSGSTDSSGLNVSGAISMVSVDHEFRKATYLNVTESAKNEIIKRVQGREGVMGIRISIATKGCSGMAYKLQYADLNNITAKDETVDISESVMIFVDPKSSLFFFGVTLDYYDNGVEYGFRFTNPNEKGKCGCGESFFV